MKLLTLGFVGSLILILVLAVLSAWGAPEFPFSNSMQFGVAIPGYEYVGEQPFPCGGIKAGTHFVHLKGLGGWAIYAGLNGKFVAAWIDDTSGVIPIHLVIGTMNPASGKLTVLTSRPFQASDTTPCAIILAPDV